MNAPIRAASAAAVLLALAAPAKAEIATLTYEAVLDNEGNTPPPAGWPANVALSGVLVYDTEAPPLNTTDWSASYPFISHQFTLSADGTSATFLAGPGGIVVTNDAYDATLDRYTDSFDTVLSATHGTFLGLDIRYHRLYFSRSTNPNNALVSTALPTSEDPFNELGLRLAIVIGETPAGDEFSAYGIITSVSFSLDSDYVLACDGFYEPFDRAVSLPGRSRRVIPLSMSLLDQDGFSIGPDTITAPVVSVSHTGSIGGGELDELAESAGRATEGNLFVWDETDSLWMFNLSSKPFSATGTYTVSVAAGDESYLVDPTCIGTFVRQ